MNSSGETQNSNKKFCKFQTYYLKIVPKFSFRKLYYSWFLEMLLRSLDIMLNQEKRIPMLETILANLHQLDGELWEENVAMEVDHINGIINITGLDFL